MIFQSREVHTCVSFWKIVKDDIEENNKFAVLAFGIHYSTPKSLNSKSKHCPR
jgi:hypothetical protein